MVVRQQYQNRLLSRIFFVSSCLFAFLLLDLNNPFQRHHQALLIVHGFCFPSATLTFWNRRTVSSLVPSSSSSSTSFSSSTILLSSSKQTQQEQKEDVPVASSPDPSTLLYQVQEQVLVDRGAYEETIMQEHVLPLLANKPKGVGSAGGFGTGSGNSKNKLKTSRETLQQQGQSHAHVLQDDGVVRIDQVLSKSTASKLRDWVLQYRQDSMSKNERFAQVLLQKNRCDLTLPFGFGNGDNNNNNKPVMDALYEILCTSAVADALACAFHDTNQEDSSSSSSPVLYEFSTLISDPGSQRQVVHPDNPMVRTGGTTSTSASTLDTENNQHTHTPPILLTCFVALQDVQIDMGPTAWLPGTHTQDAHDQFFHSDTSVKDRLLQTSEKRLGLLPQGCCAIYDSRVLHCGTANRATTPSSSSSDSSSRALFYFSFRNPQIAYPGNPASIRKSLGAAQLRLDQLQTMLQEEYGNKKKKNKKNSVSVLPLLE